MKSDNRTEREKVFGVEHGSTIKMAQPEPTVLRVKVLNDDAVIPSKAHETDSGFDLYTVSKTVIEPNSTGIAKTGLAIQFPFGYEMMIRPRSSVSTKTPIRVLIGTVDCGYTGEIGIIVDNPTNARMVIEKGTKLAQGVIQLVPQIPVVVVKELEETERGEGGFGSTGGYPTERGPVAEYAKPFDYRPDGIETDGRYGI